ncbi:MAG: LppX_LprAFG lipoprotein [Chloroflexi bacterium]|nr:LppX_LprAFG lipoprotein [Chloroflexota bacterium]
MRFRIHPLLALTIGLILVTLVAGCAAPGPAPTPTPRELTAAEILEKTAAKMKTVEYAHFQMDITGGTMVLGPGITISKLEGDVARPDKMSLQTRATVGGFVIDVNLISIGGKQYFKNPLTKRWDLLPSELSATDLLDPEKGALTIFGQAKELKRLPNEDLDGAKVFHIAGTVASSTITSVTGGTPSGEDVSVDAWIGTDDFILRKITASGAVAQGETAEVTRNIVFSRFNQPVPIEQPQ